MKLPDDQFHVDFFALFHARPRKEKMAFTLVSLFLSLSFFLSFFLSLMS